LSDGISAEVKDGICTIELAFGERNLLNAGNMAALRVALLDSDSATNIHAILLASAGPIFCGGLDIAAIRAGADPVMFASALVELLHVFPRLRKPIAAAVQGDALASGASLVAAVDYAVAASHALLGTQEVTVGIWPMVAQVPLIHRLGIRAAMENVGSGVAFTAKRAFEVGLVQEVVSAGQVRDHAAAWLSLARRGSPASEVGRPAFYEFAAMSYDDALDAALLKFAGMFAPPN